MKSQRNNIKIIFGLKLKQMRQDKNLSLSALSEQSGLSVSYINEIECGKKYPKADKIAILAEALGVSYDKLVSLKLTRNLAPLGDFLNSKILDQLPLDQSLHQWQHPFLLNDLFQVFHLDLLLVLLLLPISRRLGGSSL